MGCSVREAQHRVDSREFSEWIAYWSIEPPHADRSEYQLGVIAARVANALRSKGEAPVSMDKFMPTRMTNEDKPQAPAETMALMNLAIARHNKGASK